MRWRGRAVAALLIGAAALALLALARDAGDGVPGKTTVATETGTPLEEIGGRTEEAPSEGEGVAEEGRDAERGDGLGLGDDALGRQVAERRGSVEEVASQLIEERRDAGDCVLARAGYLDVSGKAWGCLLQGSRWVEICIVVERDGGEGCSVHTWRLDADEAAADLGAQGPPRASRRSSISWCSGRLPRCSPRSPCSGEPVGTEASSTGRRGRRHMGRSREPLPSSRTF